MSLRALSFVAVVMSLGCEKSVDLSDTIAKMKAVNERACACKDQKCVVDNDHEWAKLESSVHGVKKDNETLSTIATLQNDHIACVKKVMAELGHQ